MTVNDLLKKAFRAANVMSFAENLTAEQGQDGIDLLNGLLFRLAEDHAIPEAVPVSTQEEDVQVPASVASVMHYLLAIEVANVASVAVSQELAANAMAAELFVARQAATPAVVTGAGLPRGSGASTASTG